MRTIQGPGAVGSLVQDIQTSLNKAGFSVGTADGDYGGRTKTAVSAFQTAQGMTASGAVDDGTWPGLMNAPIPAVADRSLQLTSCIEGHGFTLAMGNFDGALLTWGIIGFTMAAGNVQKIVLGVNGTNPDSVTTAFGDNAAQLLSIMQDTRANQTVWANSITMSGGQLAQPWRDRFAAFGMDPVVRAAQLDLVRTGYTNPAIRTAKNNGLTTELGLALCFDIHVQNGGINSTAAASIAAGRTDGMAESDLLALITKSVAGASNPKWAADVLQRKMAIATGAGTVHGRNLVLENWGLSIDFSAPELA
ncbi:MAG TPA: peptidoglycan-binding protein [Terracidiphilus sp.]|jgi:hypothetical protein